jgi:hypothetical protein
MNRRRFTLELEDWPPPLRPDMPPPVPVEVRLRRLLKAAIRSFGFRCRSVGPAGGPPGRAGGPATNADGAGGGVGPSDGPGRARSDGRGHADRPLA